MEGKVKCSGCGHSWDKSDSSKKDMFICHQCGKDNVMKNGGWLNKYDDGGPVQPNYNDSSVSMSEDFVGLGYDTEGRNYSPAWGGQFQDGGYIDSVLNANKKLDWVQRLYEENTPSIKIKGQKGKATHFMESSDGRAYPTVVRMADGKLKYLGDDAYDYADKTKTYIQFPSDREAQLFSENYKKGTNVLKDFQVGGKLNPVSPTQQIQQAVQPTPTVPYLQTKDPSEFYKSWIQSPEYAKRQLLTGYSEGEDLYMPNAAASRESRLGAIEEMTPITYNTREPSKADPGIYGSPSYVNINPSDYVGTSKQAIEAHELAHIAGAMGNRGTGTREGGMSSREQEIFKESMLPMAEPKLSGVQGSKERDASKRALEDFQHSQKPDEVKADLDALRFMMYDKGIYDITKGQKFTESDFEKSKQNLGNDRVFKRLEKRVGKKNFVNLMNTIASTDNQEEVPIAMGGMSIPGSVGFSYARTTGSAPSKGKYAKKTMASAQKGKNNIKKDATNIDTGVANKIAGFELQQNPDYQYFKYLQSLPQLRQAPGRGEELMRKGLGYADVATDVMQLGNFIPNPIAQTIGKAGNLAGTLIDAYQAASDVYKGNYTSAGINAASAVLPSFLGANTFRRNSKYLQPGQPLYSLSPQAKGSLDRVNYIEPFNKVKGMTNTSLIANRALLGGLGAETAYDTSSLMGPVKKEYGGEISSAQNGQEMRFYQNGLDWKPKSMQDGGITKDNQGYWNPNNWGQPVEIDSNDITMEGVYEPLLGVSDTGDTKLMRPGKNYKFKGKKVTEFPVAQTGKIIPAEQEVSRQDYLSKFNMYDDVLKSKNYTTPYYKDNNIDTSEGDMNCINGVCYMVSNIAGVKFDKAQTKDTYTGNATFADNAMDEGYYKSNPEKEGFGTGDIFQYSRKKGSMGSRFPGEVDFKNENDLYPNHAVLIVNEFKKDGQKYFKIANNSGNDKVTVEDISESELMDRYKNGYKTYDGGITYRYDPDKVTSIKKENQEKVNVLKGSNPYAGQYSKYDSSNLSFYNNQVDNLKMTDQLGVDKNLQKYADVYSTVYKDLGKGSNMPVDSFNKLILNQIGIAGQETKFGELASNSKDLIPDSLLPVARRSREIYNYNFGTNDNWKKDYWDNNAENVQKEFASYEDFVKSFKSEDSDYNPYRTPRSIGEFQQKDLSERGNFYNYDLDSFEGQVKSSLALAVDNYHKLKTKYPDLSEEQIIDLTTLMHNAPGKALEPRFVNYYLKNNDVDYIDKVKSFTPKTISKKPSTTKKNEEIKFEEVSPEKAKSMIDYVNSLQQKKRNGGAVGINQLDAQPMKKLNQLLNFTNNPDKDNWLDKYN